MSSGQEDDAPSKPKTIYRSYRGGVSGGSINRWYALNAVVGLICEERDRALLPCVKDLISFCGDVQDLRSWLTGIAAVISVIGVSSVAPDAPATLPIILTFLAGYTAIIFEGKVAVNRGAASHAA